MVSIIILNYNTFQVTSRCIRSVIEKTHGVPYEIILVDNGSDECDPQQFREAFPKIKLIANPENTGFARGNNRGIEAASGDILLLLNSDTELKNDAVTICAESLAGDGGIGVVSARLTFPDGAIQRQCNRFPSISLELTELFRIHKWWSTERRGRRLLNGYFSHTSATFTDRIWGTFFMFPRKALDIFPGGRLTETYFMYGEDTEWCWHIRRAGYTIFYNPEAIVLHDMGASKYGSAESGDKSKVVAANRAHFMKATRGWLYRTVYDFVHRLNVQSREAFSLIRTD